MIIAAFIHTEGVILCKKYIILELAYIDVMGTRRNFLIKSPMSYTAARKNNKHIHKSLEVVMCTLDTYNGQRVYKFYEVLNFLRVQYKNLNYANNILFGYKGKSFQQNILKICSIPNINIEILGVPSISFLLERFPFIKRKCIYHMTEEHKCAQHILELINYYLCTERNILKYTIAS